MGRKNFLVEGEGRLLNPCKFTKGEERGAKEFTYVTFFEQRPALKRAESGIMLLSPGFQGPILSFGVQHVTRSGSGQGLCIGTS